MKPIRTNILVKPFPSDEQSEGGLFIPESVRKVSNKMTVIKVGNGIKDKPMKLKEGQVVYRVKDWGCPIEIEGELYFLMDMEAVLATE